VEFLNYPLVLIGISLASSIISMMCLGFVVMLNKQIKHIRRDYDTRLEKVEQSDKQVVILRSENAELRTGLMSIGQRLVEFENKLIELEQLQAAKKYDDPDAKIYSRAVKMIELGADIDEIMRECEIPKAEADLLLSLHQKS
jgi:hypothetical protein